MHAGYDVGKTFPYSQPIVSVGQLSLASMASMARAISSCARCRLSQSALSRKLQTIEQELGIQLFKRTTRSLTISPAGKQLLADTAAIPNILDSAIQRMSENFLGSQKRINIGISPSLSLAHLPGIFHPQSRFHSDVKTIISQPSREVLIRQVISNQLDIGILTHQEKLASISMIHHKMEDRSQEYHCR